jgi:hypothetical protein
MEEGEGEKLGDGDPGEHVGQLALEGVEACRVVLARGRLGLANAGRVYDDRVAFAMRRAHSEKASNLGKCRSSFHRVELWRWRAHEIKPQACPHARSRAEDRFGRVETRAPALICDAPCKEFARDIFGQAF